MHLIERIEFVHAQCQVKSAQYRVRLPQSRKDMRQRFWFASFLRTLWWVRFELSEWQAKHD